MSISIIQTMVLIQITHVRSYLNPVGYSSRTTLSEGDDLQGAGGGHQNFFPIPRGTTICPVGKNSNVCIPTVLVVHVSSTKGDSWTYSDPFSTFFLAVFSLFEFIISP